jgi:signal transduction histidine kinase
VKDSGIGISRVDQSKLFRLFGKLSGTDSASKNTSGIGLGLSICKKIVESFGGRINVQSEGVPGLGSSFTFNVKAKELVVEEKMQNCRLEESSYENIT